MFNLVPFARARREVTDMYRQPSFVCECLQADLPQPITMTVASTAISGDHQCPSLRKATMSHFAPPVGQTGRRKLSGVVIDTNTDPAFVTGQIVNAIRNGFAQLGIRKVMRLDLNRLTTRLPLSAATLGLDS